MTAWLYVAGGFAAFGVNMIWRGMVISPQQCCECSTASFGLSSR
jgi:hypothetical protein